MEKKYQSYLNSAKKNKKSIKKTFKKLSQKKDNELDDLIFEGHESAFKEIDCLKCANCCKTTGPLFIKTDIKRISKYLNLKPHEFEEKYLQIDEDEDKVLKNLPCTFLDENNYCTIYEVRPKACAEFPHTDRIKQKQILKLTEKNTMVCPAVAKIFIEIEQKAV